MKCLSNRYVSVYNHKGYDICTLKATVPANGDELDYVIDSKNFNDQVFNSIADAIVAIDELNKNWWQNSGDILKQRTWWYKKGRKLWIMKRSAEVKY